MTLEQAQELADTIARALFVNGFGERAQRLVLTVDTPRHRDLGGWGERAVADAIYRHLAKEACR